MKKTRFAFCLSGLVGVLFLMSCAGDRNVLIEETRFLLDEAKFTEAAAKISTFAKANPQDVEANLVYASALMGSAMLSGGNGCKTEDVGILGLLACLLDDPEGTETNFGTFLKIAPDDNERATEIDEAQDILINLTTVATDPLVLGSVYFQLYLADLFGIASVITRIGANSPKEVCNSNPTSALNDLVPDDYDGTALTTEESDRFSSTLSRVNDDGEKSGLPSTFGLNDRLTDILADVVTLGVVAFFDAQFNSAAAQTCR